MVFPVISKNHGNCPKLCIKSAILIMALSQENLTLRGGGGGGGVANNTGADQPGHPRSLIRAFVIV